MLAVFPIEKKWFDLILSGEKEEEYLEIKPHITRVLIDEGFLNQDGIPTSSKGWVRFRNDYPNLGACEKVDILDAYVKIDIGKGKPEWGAAPDKDYYVLKIHGIYDMRGGIDELHLISPPPDPSRWIKWRIPINTVTIVKDKFQNVRPLITAKEAQKMAGAAIKRKESEKIICVRNYILGNIQYRAGAGEYDAAILFIGRKKDNMVKPFTSIIFDRAQSILEIDTLISMDELQSISEELTKNGYIVKIEPYIFKLKRDPTTYPASIAEIIPDSLGGIPWLRDRDKMSIAANDACNYYLFTIEWKTDNRPE